MERNVHQLNPSIQLVTNPFTVEGPHLFNLVTKVRMPWRKISAIKVSLVPSSSEYS